ncbi:hypothetical protein QR680_010819 [Steinernema hermaphroditum]|uniref:DZF domain-containing protein n=1 Tax=Steinernema hermaphroditum TaxID=289476 RepID=A0AA39IRZ8_9BILA|nr:hypothetical protein QR680_010819 [Steinernema hermaphroditum]
MSYNFWGQGQNQASFPEPAGRGPPQQQKQSSYYGQAPQANQYSNIPPMASYDSSAYGWGGSAWGNSYQAPAQHDTGGYAPHNQGGYEGPTTYAAPAYGYAQPSPFDSTARGSPNFAPPLRGSPAGRRGRGNGPMHNGPRAMNGPRPMNFGPSTHKYNVPQDYEQFLATQGVGMRGGPRGRGFPPRGRGSPMGPMAPRGQRPQPRSVPTPQQLFCEICKITCAGQQTFQEHLKGKQHKKKLEAAQNQGETPSLAKNKSTYRCDVCDCPCTGKDTYEIHIKGARHQKTVTLLQKMGKPIPEGPTVITPAAQAVESVVRSTVPEIQAAQTEEQKEENGDEANGNGSQTEEDFDVTHEPVGREFIEKQADPASGKIVNYTCKLCSCSFTDPNAQDHHLKGRRHRLQYKLKVDPQLNVDGKTFVLAKKTPKRFGKKRQSDFQSDYKYVEPMNFLPVTKPKRNLNDLYVLDKDADVVITRETLDDINRIVTTIEKTLQAVSNHMCQVTDPSNTNATSGENNRILQGVLRIGDLVKGLLGKKDKTVDIVVLTNKIPTFTVVKEVAEHFLKHLEAPEGDKFTVEEEPAAGRLLVKEENSGSVVRVWFTCYLVRESVLAEKRGETVSVEKPADPLPTESCLEALAQLRRAKWYQERCIPLPACIAVIRVLRYIRQKNAIWQELPNYTMELLIEKAIRTAGYPLSAGDALRRVFEMISSGFLICGQPGLSDPCEMERSDILNQLPMDKRMEITASAQYMLRVMAMNQLYRLLDVPKREAPVPEPEANDRKRVCDEVETLIDEGESESKKIKLNAEAGGDHTENGTESSVDLKAEEAITEKYVRPQEELKEDAESEPMDTVETSAPCVLPEAVVKTEEDAMTTSEVKVEEEAAVPETVVKTEEDAMATPEAKVGEEAAVPETVVKTEEDAMATPEAKVGEEAAVAETVVKTEEGSTN